MEFNLENPEMIGVRQKKRKKSQICTTTSLIRQLLEHGRLAEPPLVTGCRLSSPHKELAAHSERRRAAGRAAAIVQQLSIKTERPWAIHGAIVKWQEGRRGVRSRR